MRIAVVSDVHGNLVALDAVLAELAERPPEHLVCLGDVAAGGPKPRETVERLIELGVPCVMGNADAWLLDPVPTGATGEQYRRIEEIDRWCAARLTEDAVEYLAGCWPTLEIPTADGGPAVLCFHGSPRSYDDLILASTSDEELGRMLGSTTAAVLVGGHTHVPLLRRYRDRLLINPGSVGRPFERDHGSGAERHPPWAEYAEVEWDRGRLAVALRRTPVDVAAILGDAVGSGMPHAEWWARGWNRGGRPTPAAP